MNEDVKREYIEECMENNELAEKELTTTFNNISGFEKVYNKDCCCFTSSEIMGFYKSLGTASLVYLMVLNNQLERYTEFCLRKTLVADGQNHYSDIDNETLGECLNKALAEAKIISWEQLVIDIGGNLFNNEADKCLALALFEGICGQEYCELVNLNISQLSKDGMLTLSSGRRLKASKLLIKYMKSSTEEYTFVTYGSKALNRNYKPDDTNVFKEALNANESKTGNDLARRRQQLKRKLDNMRDVSNSPAYSKSGLIQSGRIDMIKTFMKTDELDATEAILKYRDEIEYRYGKIPSIPRFLIQYGKYLE